MKRPDGERAHPEQFIEFTPHVASAAPEGARSGGARAAAPLQHRLPAAALGRWRVGESGEEDGDPAEGQRRAGTPTGGAGPAPPRRVPARRGVAPTAPARTPAAPPPGRLAARPGVPGGATGGERRDTRSGYQDEWLNAQRKAGAVLDVTLLSGVTLQARLVQFDTFSLVMEAAGDTLLLFKHGIAILRPAAPSPG